MPLAEEFLRHQQENARLRQEHARLVEALTSLQKENHELKSRLPAEEVEAALPPTAPTARPPRAASPPHGGGGGAVTLLRATCALPPGWAVNAVTLRSE
eukprot:gene34179-4385_t